MSYNKYIYGYSNPVSNIDPSGNKPIPSRGPEITCQDMPTRGLYEACMDLYYGIGPLLATEIGKYVQGEKGCYSGPTEYRAAGYLEGVGTTITPFLVGLTTGTEVVYDFAKMQRASFKFTRGGLTETAAGANVSWYFGRVDGFGTDSDISRDYSGTTYSESKGLSMCESLYVNFACSFGETTFFTDFTTPNNTFLTGHTF
jgi:hypothetical protein